MDVSARAITGEHMDAIVRTSAGASLVRCAVPWPSEGWARVRVRLVGLCRTDLAAAAGALAVADGRILGHELAGELDGSRVAVAPMIACGSCAGCASSRACARPGMLGLTHDGALAPWVCVPAAQIFDVPASLELRRVAYVEPVAASLAVLRAPIAPADRGVVLGRGRIAALTRLILQEHGFSRVDGDDATNAASYDFVIETDANEHTLARALDLVRPFGVVVLKSRPAQRVPLDVTRSVLADVTFAAVSYGSFADAIELVARLPLGDLLADAVPMRDFARAFALAREPGSPKRFLTVGDD